MHKRNAQWDQTENYDSFVTGCDSRISRSSTITSAMIKYWLNVQLGLLVQRSIGIQGSAALGQVYVTYDTDDVVGYPVGINQPVIDANRYVKTNSNGNFSYSESNATIAGWIFDYKKNQTDISGSYTVVTGGANAGDAYDDDLTDYVEYEIGVNTSFITQWEVSFSSRTITEIHAMYAVITGNSTYPATINIDIKIDGTWTNIFTVERATTSWILTYSHNITTRDLVTGVRAQLKGSGSATSNKCRLYDVSVFP